MTGSRVPGNGLPALLLAVLAAFPLSAAAAPGTTSVEAPVDGQSLAARRGLTLDQAVAMVERRFRAMVVRAGREESDGRVVYVLRLLSDQGRVWTVRVDAETGEVF